MSTRQADLSGARLVAYHGPAEVPITVDPVEGFLTVYLLDGSEVQLFFMPAPILRPVEPPDAADGASLTD